MTARDRTVLIVVAAVALLAAFWLLALSPKRKDASDLSAQISTATQRLQAAQASASSAEAAQRRYANDYATVARLGKAVPVQDDVPSLLYQLESVAHSDHVDFRKIDLAASGATTAAAPTGAAAAVASANGTTPTATSSTSAVSAALPPGATVGSAGFPTMPFTFDFQGSYFSMEHFLRSLSGLTTVDGKKIDVKGRLLTVDGIAIKAGPGGFPNIDASLVATAYLLPPGEGLTAGATTGGPATTTASTTTASASSATPAATASLTGSN